jgi:hypothetical protein
MSILLKKNDPLLYEPCEGVKIYYRRIVGGLFTQIISESLVDDKSAKIDDLKLRENTVFRSIVSWEGVWEGEEGNLAEITIENVRLLPGEIFTTLFVLCSPKGGGDPLPDSEATLNSNLKRGAAGASVKSAGAAGTKTTGSRRAKRRA